MPATDNWSANWCADKFKHEHVLQVRVIEDNLVELEVEEVGRVLVATMSLPVVSLADVPPTALRPDVQFLLNISKDALFQGDLINYADRVPMGVGGVGDLLRAINKKELRKYFAPERSFILRALSQHDAVAGVEMLNNYTYLIHRRALGAYQVLVVTEYDVTAEVVRAALQKFGHSRTILANNPSGKVTPEAKEAAKSAGVRIVTISQLLGALNS